MYRGTASGGEGTSPIATGITGTAYTAVGLTNGTAYYFKVAAVSSGGTSGFSNEATATPSGSGTAIYSYSVVYDSASNVASYNDSVNGAWTNIAYDSLNRLSGGTWAPVSGSSLSFCWTYDDFGNMTTEATASQPFTNSPGAGACQEASGATLYTNEWAAYGSSAGNNQVTAAALMSGGPLGYDAAGDVQQDNLNKYAYDGDGRVCAVENLYSGGVTQYIYDAEGTRVAKGTAHTALQGGVYVLSCDTTQNGFTLTTTYVIGPAGEQLTETDGQGNWKHTNVYAEGQVTATYDADPKSSTQALHFHFSDWLGTRRAQTDYAGNGEETCASWPFGDQLSCQQSALATADDATEHHFTGKERDTESGNDYFGARYYASSMGRWMSPDPINLTNARAMNPANTLNKYTYGANNPLKYVDPDGKDITIYYRAPSGLADFGHVMLGVLNQDTGKTAFIDFYPKNGTNLLGMGAGTFNPGDMAERGQQNANGQFASLTIQTNPEQAQALIDAITKMENGQTPDFSAFLGANCTTLTEDALKDLGLDYGDQSPSAFWQDVWGHYSQDALDNPFKVFLTAPQKGGHDYGNPRFNNQSQMMFYLYWLQMHPRQDNSSVTTTETYSIDCKKNPGACK